MPNFKRALITGISGSGGSLLADYIVNNHPEVELHGISRWHSTTHNKNLEEIKDKIKVHECDLTDFGSIFTILKRISPDVIFHLAAFANVRASFETPLSVLHNNIMGTANLLEAIRLLGINPRVMVASTPEVYGQPKEKHIPITEECPLDIVNPYAVSKVTQDLLGEAWSKSFGLDIVRTRMFTYINPRREDLFATSFAMQVAKIEEGMQKELLHGNLNSTRAMIDAKDAMHAYWLAAEKGRKGEVYNIAGTKIITVGEFLDVLKKMAKCEIPSKEDPKLFRPIDVTMQIPCVDKFRRETGWEPKISFEESVRDLLEHCRKEVANEKLRKHEPK